jgi:hypothetical protein
MPTDASRLPPTGEQGTTLQADTTLLSNVLAAVVGAALALMGGAWQSRRNRVRELRVRMYHELLPPLWRACANAPPTSQVELPPSVLVQVGELYRVSVLAGRRDNALVNAVRETIQEWAKVVAQGWPVRVPPIQDPVWQGDMNRLKILDTQLSVQFADLHDFLEDRLQPWPRLLKVRSRLRLRRRRGP